MGHRRRPGRDDRGTFVDLYVPRVVEDDTAELALVFLVAAGRRGDKASITIAADDFRAARLAAALARQRARAEADPPKV
jgi:hypothetical protein